MEIDDDTNLFKKPSTAELRFQNFGRVTTNASSTTAAASQSVSTTTTPMRSMNYHRRGSSGIFFNTMFCMSHHFRHLKSLHMESMEEGLNIIKQRPARAVFRSSLPATPIATPIYHESFPYFTEQSLMERLCRAPSPRRTYSRNSSRMETSESCDQQQPMDICSPTTIDEESLSSNSASSPNKEQFTINQQQQLSKSNETITDIQSSLNDIYFKISEQFNPD